MVDGPETPNIAQFGAFDVAAAASVVDALILAVKVRGAHARLRADLTEHRLPITHQLRVPPAKPVKEKKLDDGRVVPARGGGYAFDKRAFLVGQEIPVSVVAPHSGNASGETSTAVREAPAVINDIIGPRIGTSVGRWVALSAEDLWMGIMFLGVPGSGKSVALQNIWSWMCRERTKPSGRPGFPGADNTVIAIETKGQGASAYHQLAAKVGDAVGLADLSDDSTPAIDMFPRTGSLEHQAR